MQFRPKDWRGVPIKEGTLITYPVGSGSSISITAAEVVEIRETTKTVWWRDKNDVDANGYPKHKSRSEPWFKLKVRQTGLNWRGEPHGTSWITKVENATVIPSIKEFHNA